MARQSTDPVHFNQSTRKDTAVLMTSARAGVVAPVAYIPLLAGDSCSGRVGIDVQLKEMPKPLLNGVFANVQAWFVPKSAHPFFSGKDELLHAMAGEKIKAMGTNGSLVERSPAAYYQVMTEASSQAWVNGPIGKTLGVHIPAAAAGRTNTDLVDAFNLIYNFRLAAHSSRLPRRQYFAEGDGSYKTLPPAFWPSSRFSRVVPDYERALIVGALDLDVAAGRLPIHNLYADNSETQKAWDGSTSALPESPSNPTGNASGTRALRYARDGTTVRRIYAEMAGEIVTTTLADIDKARTTQAFAKLRTAYAGNDTTGFDNDDALVALLMQGISVPKDEFKRPWLLDSKRVAVNFAERYATDAANLDASVTLGRASAQLSLNVPQQDVGGLIIVTVEVLPERIDERMADEWMLKQKFDDLPNALRDVQRVEPVDLVLNRRVDAKHVAPNQLYGYEPMNDQWNRDFTRLGGDFYMATPGGGWTENRSNIWQTEIVNPTFGATHYLAPAPFPHNVFADPAADAFECVVRHAVTIAGLTQIGDVLAENNDDYAAIEAAGDGL